MKSKRAKLSREVPGAIIDYRKVQRPLVVDLDLAAGKLSVRPKGCRRAKTYLIADLFSFGQQFSFL